MARREKPKKRPVIESVDELIEHFLDINTSVEEAHGLLGVLAHDGIELPNIGNADRSDRVKIVRFLCRIGNEIEIDPSVADHGDLRIRARIILARHAIPNVDKFHFDDGPVEGDSVAQTVCRFYAADSWDHKVYNERDLEKLRAYFNPYGAWFSADGFRKDFYKTLITLELTDLLVTRRDIGAIRVLSDDLGTMSWAGEPQKKFNQCPADETLAWGDWESDTTNYSEEFIDELKKWLTSRCDYHVDVFEHDLKKANARAGFVLGHQLSNFKPPDCDLETAAVLAQLCSMAEHLLSVVKSTS